MDTMASPTATAAQRQLRRPGWLLIGTLGAAVLYIVAAVVTMPVERAADLTPAQMADIRPGWVIINALWATPVFLVAAAYWAVTGALRASVAATSLATTTRALVAVSVVGATCYLALALSVLDLNVARLGDDGRHDASTLASLVAYWVAVLATAILGVALFRSRVLRRTGLVVAVIAGLLLLTDVIAYLPGLVGSVALNEVASFPPMLYAVLWLALGIGLVRRRVTSSG